VPIAQLRRLPNQSIVAVAGLVTVRQRPGTAKGILFLLLEDEGGMVNVVVRPELQEQQRELWQAEMLMIVRGVLESRERRLNLVAHEAWPLTEMLPDRVKSAAARRVHESVKSLEPPQPHNYR
jgi:error-prone DNA polymerase